MASKSHLERAGLCTNAHTMYGQQPISKEDPMNQKEYEYILSETLPHQALSYFSTLVSVNRDNPVMYLKLADAAYKCGNWLLCVDSLIHAEKIYDIEAKKNALDRLDTRFIFLGEWGGNIGHIALLLDTLTKLAKLNLLSKEKRVLYARTKDVTNACYLNYVNDFIDVNFIEDSIYDKLLDLFFCLRETPGLLKLTHGYIDLYSASNMAAKKWEGYGLPPLLKLRLSDVERGRDILEQMGVPRNAWFVALHVREGDNRPARSNANANIETYMQSMKTITQRGGWVFRMGHHGMTPLPVMDNVVDYANSQYKTDWMDIFLFGECKFMVGTSSGPLNVPGTFGRPVLYTNSPHIGLSIYQPYSIMMPKLYYSNSEKRLFSFHEMLQKPLGWTVSSIFDGIDCTILDNSPEEINQAVIEMFDICDLLSETENSALSYVLSDKQKKFNDLRHLYGDTGQMTIANSFIEKYNFLL